MIDKDGKLFGRVSVIDVFAVVLVLALAAGTLYRFRAPVAQVSGGKEKITFYVKIQDVRYFTEDYYQVGMTAYDNKTGVYLGKIVDVETKPFYDTLNFVDGSMAVAQKLDKIEIILKIEGEGMITDDDYLVSGSYKLMAGSGVSLLTKYVTVEGYILDIEA